MGTCIQGGNGTRTSRGEDTMTITAQGGTRFHVSVNGEFLGSMEFGAVRPDGQYIGDDDEIVDAARAQFAIPESVAAVVR